MLEECPICYESSDSMQHIPCMHCQKTICTSCNLAIHHTRPTCPFCRRSWRSSTPTERLEEWRRRIQRTHQLAQWMRVTTTAVVHGPPDPSYQNIAALAQLLLMGAWAWTTAA